MPRRAGVPIAVLLALLVASCGFQLRGHFKLPPQMATTVVEGVDIRVGFGRELAELLRENGAAVATTTGGEEATFVKITQVAHSSRLQSLGVATTVNEYELSLTVAFSAASSDETIIVDEQSIVVVRSHLHESSAVLGSQQAEARMIEDMNREAARLVLYRLTAAARQ